MRFFRKEKEKAPAETKSTKPAHNDSSSKIRAANRAHVIKILTTAKKRIAALQPPACKNSADDNTKSTLAELFKESRANTTVALEHLIQGLDLMNQASKTSSPNTKKNVLKSAYTQFKGAGDIASSFLSLITDSSTNAKTFACKPIFIELIALIGALAEDQHIFYCFKNESTLFSKDGGAITRAIRTLHQDFSKDNTPFQLPTTLLTFEPLESKAPTDSITVGAKDHVRKHIEFTLSVVMSNLGKSLYTGSNLEMLALTGVIEALELIEAQLSVSQHPSNNANKEELFNKLSLHYRSSLTEQLKEQCQFDLDEKDDSDTTRSKIIEQLDEEKQLQTLGKELQKYFQLILAQTTIQLDPANLTLENTTALLKQFRQQRSALESLLQGTLGPLRNYGRAAIGNKFSCPTKNKDGDVIEVEAEQACSIDNITAYFNQEGSITPAPKSWHLASSDSDSTASTSSDEPTSLSIR